MQTSADSTQVGRTGMRLAIGLGLLSLALAAVATFSGGATRWETWALPILVVLNVLVQYYEVAARHPRAAKAYYAASGLVSLIIIASLFL